VLRARFVKREARRDHVYVIRSDGTSTEWSFPSYGQGLPHDLCHLVVESSLGLRAGFWGFVDRGVEVRLVDNQATLMRNGRRLIDEAGIDLSQLLEAEEVVARLAGLGLEPGVENDDSDPISADADRRVRVTLDALGRQWAALTDGESITLEF
jgi:hypothetical protein